MKTKSLSLLLLLFANLYLSAQDTYKISFDIKDFAFEKNDNVLNINPIKQDYFLLNDTLLPALPYFSYHILRPQNSTSKTFEVKIQKEVVFKDVSILPNPKELVISSISNNIQGTIAVASRSSFAPCLFAGDNCLKGYSFATFNVTPFVYDEKLRELSFISEITIIISNNTKQKSERTKNQIQKKGDKTDILNMVINPEQFNVFYSDDVVSKTLSQSLVTDVEYLIVTTTDLSDSFKPLMGWKTQKGIRTEIITLNDIYTNYSGDTEQLKIKNCLYDYYQNRALKWVLLGGDDTLVPVQRCYAIVGETTADSRIPTDLFYACFDNAFDWDANDNGIAGEVNDNIDLYPEIYLSRLPFRSKEDVNVFVNKLLAYEKQTIPISHVNNLLLTGTELWKWPDNPLDKSDAHQKTEKMYNNYIAPYWNPNKYYFYDTGTCFSGDSLYDLTAQNLQNQLDKEYHFIHMATHGSALTWSMEKGASYNTSNASAQQNKNATIITTMACTTNAFDDPVDPCLSEAFIRNPNNSCLVYLGGSRAGWGYPKTASLGTSFQYNAQFFKKLFTGEPASDKYKFAAVVSAAKQQMISSSTYDGSGRWVQFSLNPIGEPTMDIFTENPQMFQQPTITTNGTNVTVSSGGVNDCTIALTSMNYGKSYFHVVENTSSHTFTNVTTPYYVTITKHNYIPYIYYPENIYIQNQVLDNDYYFQGRNIYIGNAVTTSKPQGNVIIKNGAHVIFEATEQVEFNAGFECEAGSTFEVIKQ